VKQPPECGPVIEIAEVGGLHHRYERRAAWENDWKHRPDGVLAKHRLQASLAVSRRRSGTEEKGSQQDEIHLPELRAERLGKACRTTHLQGVLRRRRRRDLHLGSWGGNRRSETYSEASEALSLPST